MWAAALLLSKQAEVTLLTTSRSRAQHEELQRAGDDPFPEGVRVAFVDEPEGDVAPFSSWDHAWSVRLLDGVARLHPDGGPDILEFGDYHAEGFASVHARRAQDPRLRNTTLAVRLHTSAEMCAVLNEVEWGVHLDVLGGLERFSLRFADALLQPGGDTLDYYTEFYGEGSLAPALESPLPMTTGLSAPPDVEDPPADGRLRLLYLNRLERRKGIVELISAIRSLPEAELELTLVGGDTATGPGRTSMRAQAEKLAAGDSRIRFADRVPHEDVPGLIAAHHAVVVPTRWETFSYVVREALACNRPVVATAAGGIVDVVRRGESGWLAESGTTAGLEAILREILGERDELTRLIAEGLPRAAFERDAPDQRTLGAYVELVERRRDAARPQNGVPQPAAVAALVACEAGGGDPLPTLVSLGAQRGSPVRPIVVAEPSVAFPGPGPVLAHADSVVAAPGDHGGPEAAWAAGLPHASEELVLVISAGAVLERDFLRRATVALSSEPALAWVTAFTGAGDAPVNAPPGSYGLPLGALHASPAVGVVRRAALEAALRGVDGAPADGHNVFVRLAHAGAHGLVLQEPLVTSLPRRVPRPAAAQP